MAPLFSTLAQLMPNLKTLLNQANKNAEEWKNYKETEKDKEIYTKKRVFTNETNMANLEDKNSDDSDLDTEFVNQPPKL